MKNCIKEGDLASLLTNLNTIKGNLEDEAFVLGSGFDEQAVQEVLRCLKLIKNPRVAEIQQAIEDNKRELNEIQENCDHKYRSSKAGSDTGHLSEVDDSYWYDWHCPTCDKSWTTDQK